MKLLALLFAASVLGGGMGPPEPVPFKTLDRGDLGGIERPRHVTVRTANDWKMLTNQRGRGATAPAVDFTRSMVVGVFLGTKPTGGYSVEITGIDRQGAELIVTFRERAPGRDDMVTQVITAPYHLVTIDRFDGPITFKRAE
jgi:protease stability complex PrcB-like protein